MYSPDKQFTVRYSELEWPWHLLWQSYQYIHFTCFEEKKNCLLQSNIKKFKFLANIIENWDKENIIETGADRYETILISVQNS